MTPALAPEQLHLYDRLMAKSAVRTKVAMLEGRIAELETIAQELFNAIYDEGEQSVELGQRAAAILANEK